MPYDLPDAPWIGKTREEYFGYDDEPEVEYDEDFEYESQCDLRLEEEECEG